MVMVSTWTPAQDDELRRLRVEEQLTYSLIGPLMGMTWAKVESRGRWLHLPTLKTTKRGIVWTAAEDERMTTLYLDGQSCERIGGAMCRSRNSIVGRLHRLGVVRGPGDPAPSRANKRYREPVAKRPDRRSHPAQQAVARARERAKRPPPPPRPIIVEPLPSHAVNMDDLTWRHCRWPVNDWMPGEGVTALFCGAPKVRGCLCAFHAARAFTPAPGPADREAAARKFEATA